MVENVKTWVLEHRGTTTAALAASVVIAMAGPEAMKYIQAVDEFMAAVDEGRIEFTVKDERGNALDMRNNERLLAELDRLAQQRSSVMIQMNWPNKPPVCQGTVSALEMQAIFQGDLVNPSKPEGLKIDLGRLNDVCGQLKFGKSQAGIEPAGPYSAVVANGAVMEQRVVEPKLQRS